jgi:hypothetical protein
MEGEQVLPLASITFLDLCLASPTALSMLSSTAVPPNMGRARHHPEHLLTQEMGPILRDSDLGGLGWDPDIHS